MHAGIDRCVERRDESTFENRSTTNIICRESAVRHNGLGPPAALGRIVTFPRDIDELFENMMEAWRGSGSPGDETAAYPCDIREEDGQICVDAELPGFAKDEVKVTLDKGVLSIAAEHKEEQQKKDNGRNYLQERRYRRIQRAFSLPAPVNESSVQANLKDGVLHLTLQKSEESKAHQISVK